MYRRRNDAENFNSVCLVFREKIGSQTRSQTARHASVAYNTIKRLFLISNEKKR